MMGRDDFTLFARRSRKILPDGSSLRLLTAMEVLEARREALEIQGDGKDELALYSNACLLAKAWERGKRPLYESGEAVLKALTVSRIQSLAREWAAFDRQENPGPAEKQERIDRLKKAWSTRRRSAFDGVCSSGSGRSQQSSG